MLRKMSVWEVECTRCGKTERVFKEKDMPFPAPKGWAMSWYCVENYQQLDEDLCPDCIAKGNIVVNR